MTGTAAQTASHARGAGPGRTTLALVAMSLCASLASGCSHAVLIRTVPEGATVSVDGEERGTAPLVVETRSGVFETMSVTAEKEGFEKKRVLVEQSEWFLWPALLAATPFLGAPLLVVFPPFGAIVAVAWAVATSPTLLSLAFVRTFPDEVTIELEPRGDGEGLEFLPTDWWTIPEEYAPNPLPGVPVDDETGAPPGSEPAPPDTPTRDPDEMPPPG